MKKLILLFFVFAILMAIGCRKDKPAELTILGEYTPYDFFPEKMSGKVEKVIEKNYLAILEGDSYVKGSLLTQADRDSLGGWTPDFEAAFDRAGDLVYCITMDEKGKTVQKREIIKENNVIVKGNYYNNDTLRFYDNLKLDERGKIVELTRYKAPVDTLLVTCNRKTNDKGDTIVYQWYNFKGEPIWKDVQIFNNLGEGISHEAYNREGVYQWAYVQEYNEKGKLSETSVFDKDKKISATVQYGYEYDEHGNWIKSTSKDNKNKSIIAERTYIYFE